LSAERTALNFLCRLSGIATLTAKFVSRIKGTRAVILDTRKTTPGWRELEKYAVRCGGGKNHRMGLYDMVLIKDNHLTLVGSVTEALNRARAARVPVMIEVKTIDELREALAAGAKRIMLDNMTVPQLRRAVQIAAGQAKLEASGGVSLKNVQQIARTGVDYISIGALTHSAPAADISLEFSRE
jgi:nicotinate-nucleotide pyrophosphorylase (carboxylating)